MKKSTLIKFWLVLFPLTILSTLALAQEKKPSTLIGIGLQQDAAFPGAEQTQVLPVPLISWQANNFFMRSGRGMEEAGVHWQLNDNFTLGSQLAFELSRDSKDSKFLQQARMPNIAYGVSAGVHAEYSTHIGPAPVDTLLRLRQRSGAERGALADLRIEVGIYGTDTLGVQTYVQTTWANQQAMNSDFGVKPVNAAFAGISPYQADAGLQNYLIGVAGKIDLSIDWIAVGTVEYKSLTGDASDSPVTEKKNSEAITLGVIYRL